MCGELCARLGWSLSETTSEAPTTTSNASTLHVGASDVVSIGASHVVETGLLDAGGKAHAPTPDSPFSGGGHPLQTGGGGVGEKGGGRGVSEVVEKPDLEGSEGYTSEEAIAEYREELAATVGMGKVVAYPINLIFPTPPPPKLPNPI